MKARCRADQRITPCGFSQDHFSFIANFRAVTESAFINIQLRLSDFVPHWRLVIDCVRLETLIRHLRPLPKPMEDVRSKAQRCGACSLR